MDEASVVVARALIEDEIHLQEEPPGPLQVRVGQPLRVRFAYRMGGTPLGDGWSVRLTTRQNGDERSLDGLRDDAVQDDRIWDEVAETFSFDRPGTEVIDFEATAHRDDEARRVSGAVRVLVLP